MIEAPDEPVLLEIVEYTVDGDLAGVRCHCLFKIVGTNTTFWLRDLDWWPDVQAQYWWSKTQLGIATDDNPSS